MSDLSEAARRALSDEVDRVVNPLIAKLKEKLDSLPLRAHTQALARVYSKLLAAESERDRLAGEVERMKGLLRPFADYAERVDESASDQNPVDDACPPKGVGAWNWDRNARPVPTLGDCRRAAQALKDTRDDA